jgi:predicted RNA-binding protein with PIN domain
MKRIIVIDGYNLMFQLPELRRQVERDLEGARERFLDVLAAHAVKKQAEYLVVFDGDGQDRFQARRRANIKVLFSKPPQKADPLIKKTAAERKHTEDMVVVTSDQDISRYARICGVKVETSQKFALDMTLEPRTDLENKFDQNMSEDEVNDWMALFRQNQSGEGDS